MLQELPTVLRSRVYQHNLPIIYIYIQGGARSVIPLIVHVTHFYYYKNI